MITCDRCYNPNVSIYYRRFLQYLCVPCFEAAHLAAKPTTLTEQRKAVSEQTTASNTKTDNPDHPLNKAAKLAVLAWWFTMLWSYDGTNRYIRVGPFTSLTQCEQVRTILTDSRHLKQTHACETHKPMVMTHEQGIDS